MEFKGLHYFGRGGGCFLEGTEIRTPYGIKNIEDFVPGDEVISLNELTGKNETSVVEKLDILAARKYYMINYSVRATESHPFYTKNGIKTVKELKVGDILITKDGEEPISNINIYEEDVVVYNLINVTPNHNYYADNFLVHNKGGGCFLAGTRIRTSNGTKAIEKIMPRDIVMSYNERTRVDELSVVSSVQILKSDGYYILNGNLKVTETHPMYVDNPADDEEEMKIVPVFQLKIGDWLVTDVGIQQLKSIVYVDKEVKVYNLINVEPNHNYYAGTRTTQYLVHNKGGGGGHASASHASSSARSSSSSVSTSKPTSSSTGSKSTSSTTKSSYNTSSSRSTTSSKTAPGSKVTTSDGKSVKTSSVKPTNKSVNQQAGITGVDGYAPTFRNGYAPPAGSVVYYPQHSFGDYLPWIYLFSHDSPSNDQATVVQPDGKQVQAQPTSDGVDGIAFINWILLIVIVAAAISGIVWGVNKWASRNDGY